MPFLFMVALNFVMRKAMARPNTSIAKVGLCISAEKSKVMHTNAQGDMPRIKADGCNIKEVDWFTYLGSTIG